jgi:hypothetical protein
MSDNRVLTAVLVTAIVMAVAAPSTAAAGLFDQGAGNGRSRGARNGGGRGAGNGAGGGAGVSQSVRTQDARRDQLRLRIERMLVRRQAKFDRVEARLTKRIDRLTAIADAAAAKGIDVSAAQAALTKAGDQLAIAAAEETKAQESFKAVIDASDKRVAFAAARTQAKVAQKALQRARLDVVNALRLLRSAIAAAGTTTP